MARACWCSIVRRSAGKTGDFAICLNIWRPGDCLVLNDSRVLPSRLFGQREGGEAEVMLLEPVTPDAREWRALVRPGRKLRVGARCAFRRSVFS